LNGEWWGFHISHVGSLWQLLSFGTITFDLLTLPLKFDLHLKNFKNSHIIWMVIDVDFMFHMLILCDKNFVLWRYMTLDSCHVDFASHLKIVAHGGIHVLQTHLVFIYLFIYSHASNFSAIWWLSPLPVTGLQVLTYARHSGPLSREGSLSCHTYCEHMKDRHPCPTVEFDPPTPGSSDLCTRRSNHWAMRATNFNLDHNFWLVGARAFIVCMCISSGRNLDLILWFWPWSLTFSKTLTLVETFDW
jgi:hypothetical protein